MGKELSLARAEEEGRTMLLAITGSGEPITAPSIRNKRTQETTPSQESNEGPLTYTKTKGKSGRKTKRVDASSTEPKGRGRDNQDRESDRGDEGEDRKARRSAQELGITFPSSYCNETETVPHHWIRTDKVDVGSLYQCKKCYIYLWLPGFYNDAERLSKLIREYGKDEGYCRFLNKHRAGKLLMAKMQDLRRLATEITDKREFAKLTDKILSDKEYDRKEATNG